MPEAPDSPPPKKQRLPTTVYIGAAILGFAILGFLFFIYAFVQARGLVAVGAGDPANFRAILIFVAVFLVGVPMWLGLYLIRRPRRLAERRKDRDS